jgi:hypothetical protein
LKTDSAPVRGDGYEPGSSKFRPRANAETSHSVRVGAGGCRNVIGGSEKFLYGMVRSRKPLLWSPFIVNNYYSYSKLTYTIQYRYIAFNSIPRPLIESIDDLTLITNERERTDKRANIRPLPTPRAIARGACGHSPFYCCNTA